MKASSFFLFSLLILASCVDKPPTMAENVESLKAACNSACDGAERTVTLALPPGTELYTTTQAICLKQDARLSCGTCSCVAYGLAGNVTLTSDVERNVTCVFSDTGENLTLSCD